MKQPQANPVVAVILKYLKAGLWLTIVLEYDTTFLGLTKKRHVGPDHVFARCDRQLARNTNDNNHYGRCRKSDEISRFRVASHSCGSKFSSCATKRPSMQ